MARRIGGFHERPIGAFAGRGSQPRVACKPHTRAYQRQVPSPNSFAMSGTTAARPSAWYAVRQSGLRAFSIASCIFVFGFSTGGMGKGSAARLAPYRYGFLSIAKCAGKGHGESHPTGDELIYILDGNATLETVGEDGHRSSALSTGMLAVNPKGAWHRFSSTDGVALLAVTPPPSEIIDRDVDDPWQVERTPA